MNPFESIADSVGVFGKETSILNRFLFPAPPSSYGWSSFEGELMCVVGREGNIVPCTIMPGTCTNSDSVFNSEDPASTIIIYCHANGEDVGVLYEAGHWLCDTLGVHVLIPEYPGYGMAPGSPNELSVNNNICAAYDFAVNGLHWNPKRVIFFGRSIGTGPAVRLASELECGGLILVSPYTSVKDLVSQHAGIITSWLTAELADLFPSDEFIQDVQCPTLIVHGAQDRVISCHQARTLYKMAASDKKRLVVLEGIGHHGIDLHFAVAHECPRLFDLHSEPRYMDIDGYLADPAMQGDTVASPVPVFDCRSCSWSRPTLERGTQPFLRLPPQGSAAAAMLPPPPHHLNPPFPHPSLGHAHGVGGGLLSPDTAASCHYRHDSNTLGPSPATALGAQRQTDAAGNTVGFIVTDDVLLAHLRAEVSHERLEFIKARKSPDKSPQGGGQGAGSGGMPQGGAGSGSSGRGASAAVQSDKPLAGMNGEDMGHEVEYRTDDRGRLEAIAGPPSGPGGAAKLFIY